MWLSELLQSLESFEWRSQVDVDVTQVVYSSKQVTPGALFVAIPGLQVDGRNFVHEALKRGACAVVFEGEFFDNLTVPQIRVSGARKALSRLSAQFFVHPTKKMYVTGITGTNGKTTLTYLCEALWQAAGLKSGIMGTINTRYANYKMESSQTTPESRDLQEVLAQMATAYVTHVAMEVSSHGLALQRVSDCHFDSAVFTNLTQDHLDYHKTLEDYFEAKASLFTDLLLQSEKKNKWAIIHGDDPYGKKIIHRLPSGILCQTYGLGEQNDLRPLKYELSVEGIKATLMLEGSRFELVSPLMGEFNLQNLMAAILVGRHTGLSLEKIQQVLATAQGAPGRLERIKDPNGRILFVDYAHTPDALANVLKTIRQWAPKKVITVFGCGGDRDPTKRPLMGFEAARYSDLCVITSDNPRTEDPKKIIEDIIPGVLKAGMFPLKEKGGYEIIEDRKMALHKAIDLSGPKDVVLVAGKGHEDYQIVGKVKTPFSDQQVLSEKVKRN